MATAREILEARRGSIETELTPLISRRDDLFVRLIAADETIEQKRKELAAIDTALKSLAATETTSQRIPIIQAILEVLKDKPNGLTARDILTALNDRHFDGTLVRHSLSPQLSRLKDRDRKIEYRNDRWVRIPDQPNLKGRI